MNQSPFVSAAVNAVRAAESVIRQYYRSDLDVARKADASPVTQADIESERVIRGVLAEAFPEHGFFGEELGRSSGDHEYLWLIDPIDGTKSFVRGYPFFSTQVALRHRDLILVGVSNAPVYGELLWAERGCGAWQAERRLRVSGCRDLREAVLSCGNLQSLAADHAAWKRLGSLVRSVDRFRGYGDFLHYHLLAGGHIDIVVESDLNILDIAALSLIVEEAGGVCTQLDGAALGLSSTTMLAASSPELHAEVLQRLRSDDGR